MANLSSGKSFKPYSPQKAALIVHGVLDDQRVRLASLEFLDYAMQWWHRTLMDNGLNKRSTVVSWNDLKACLHDRYVPPHFRKDLLLKLQRFLYRPGSRK